MQAAARGRRWRAILCLMLGTAGGLPPAVESVWGHAFVSRSEPRTGATISESPAHVRIWFDGPIEPMFATISVENREQRRVDKGDGRVSPRDARLLEVGLPPLAPGRYRVSWSVIARDGHRREGDFSFLLK
jgi:methionine-rich copper-binding protein CopC